MDGTCESTSSVWFLVGRTGQGDEIRHVPVSAMPFRIGRRGDVSLCLANQTVSSLHAEIIDQHGTLIVRDLQSTNGTYVNAVPVRGEAALCDNDLVQFSDVVFRLRRVEASLERKTVTGDAGDQAIALIQFDKLMDGPAALPFYQPIVKFPDFEVVGYEVLGRSRLYGLRRPQEMFLVAAQLGLEAELSRLFRQEGIQQGVKLQGQPKLFVNTHPVELVQPGLVESLRKIRDLNATHPITLEIHEAAVTDATSMRELQQVLEDMNIELAYDDFGAGQARLVELAEVRPNYLKFDKQLIQGIHAAPAERQQMLASLVEIVHNLGVTALAECVECEADSEACRQFGFDLGQGYFYGKPASIRRVSRER